MPEDFRRSKWITREVRRNRAVAWVRSVGDRFHAWRDNTGNGAHITIWFTDHTRVEWWPGTMKFRYQGITLKYGHLDDFVEWVLKERRMYDDPTIR